MSRTISKRSKQAEKPPVKEKFIVKDETFDAQVIPKFTPANDNQKSAVAMLREGRSVVVLRGSAVRARV